MTSDQREFERLAALCDTLAQSASAPEEREHLLDLANQWRAMATRPKIYQVSMGPIGRLREIAT